MTPATQKAVEPITIERIEQSVKEHFIASLVGSWEEAWYFDGLLEIRLLMGGYPSEKKIPRDLIESTKPCPDCQNGWNYDQDWYCQTCKGDAEIPIEVHSCGAQEKDCKCRETTA